MARLAGSRVLLAALMLAAGAPAGARPAGALLLPRGTPVRLMVLNEVTSRTAKSGDRFPLLVDQPVTVGGAVLVPAGAKAWGEVTAVRENGSVGTSGRLAARLLWIDLPGGRVPLAGASSSDGWGAGIQAAVAAVAFGLLAPLALFTRGNNAKLKAGERVDGTVAETTNFDATLAVSPEPVSP